MDEKEKGTDRRKFFNILNKDTKGGENMAFLCHINLTSTSIHL